ncbi:hypothetical protein B8V81_3917 [Paenibacillus pasadenensis]|uniref:Uncharacterized protein n=1 Tax=Paenibacillus pasadenensis TaxID=217090 RepID=A0A2N5N555_9BACL|nr:hypothetical protein B8V81_3917 [Paenibacillus pasadenensis]
MYNKEERFKRFMYASMMLQLEEEEKARKASERAAARR